MKRIVIPEILDLKTATPREVSDSLIDLNRINRWFGGIAVSKKLVVGVAQREQLSSISLLDVGSATGDTPQALSQQLKPQGIELQYTLLDRERAHFGTILGNGRAPVVGDALSLPFRDQSFDVVTCSLFAHHLEPDQIILFAQEALRVARCALLINDLRRSMLHFAMVCIGTVLFKSRATRHDAPVSVLRSYTRSEMRDLLQKTQASRVDISNYYLYRMGAIAWK